MKKNNLIKSIIITLIMILIDRVLKFLMESKILKNFGILKLFINNKAPNIKIFVISTLVLFLILAIYIFKSHKKFNIKIDFSLSLIFAGGICNLVDVIFTNTIIDYFSIFSVNFNLGDIYTILGFILFIIFTINNITKAKKDNK